MQKSLVLVRNTLLQSELPDGVIACLESVNELLAETLEALDHHEI